MSIKAQALAQIERAKKKYGAKKFIAYFQAYTNTYAPSDVLRERYSEAIVDDVVQLSVSTRPDCVSQDVLDVLNEFKNRVEVSVELGLQSANYRTLMILNDAVLRCKKNGLEVIAHVIVDLPWDDQLDVLETARILSALGVDGVKIHTLYVVKGTELERMVQNGLNLLSFEEFVERICIFFLSSDIVIHRLVSDPPKGMTLLGNWNMSSTYWSKSSKKGIFTRVQSFRINLFFLLEKCRTHHKHWCYEYYKRYERSGFIYVLQEHRRDEYSQHEESSGEPSPFD